MADTSKTAAAAAQTSPSPTGAQPDPLLGRTINERFRIISMLARGGMGKVYKAEQAPLGRICAVKVLNPNYAGDNDPEFHRRFFLEASIASKLSHPNTVTIFDYGKTDDDIFYMAMELLEGKTLHRLIREEAPIDGQRVIHIARQICRSLREAHGLGVIHRDLKPANVYLIKNDEESDFVKVLDFGLVKNVEDTSENLTQTGLFMGSPKYMAPEQIRGEKVTARTDIYALGVVMYEMLCGKVPFDRGNSVNTLMAHVSDPVPPMRDVAPNAVIPFPLEEVVYKCLQKRMDDRYGSMDEVLGALKKAAAQAYGGYQSQPTGEHSTAFLTDNPMISRSGEHATGSPNGTPSMTPGGSRGDVGPTPSSGVIPREALRTNSETPGTPAASNEGAPAATIAMTPANPAGLPDVPADPQPRSKTPLVVGIVALLAVAGAAAVFVRKGGDEARTNAAANAAGAAQAGGGVGAGNSARPVVRLTITSDPPGAEVLEGGTSLGRTPLDRDLPTELADPARAHTFTLRLEGHDDATLALGPGAALTGRAQLTPRAAAPAAAADAGAPTARPTARPNARPVARPQPQPQQRRGNTGNAPRGYRDIDDWK